MKQGFFRLTSGSRSFFLALSIILGFVFIVLFSSIYVSDAIKNNNACGCVIPIPYMILILSSLGLFTGSIAFYLIISQHIKEKKTMTKNLSFTLKFLETHERLIIKELIKHKGRISQSQLQTITRLHRVKIHRILEKLLAKGIIKKSSKGQTNVIQLAEELQEVFS